MHVYSLLSFLFFLPSYALHILLPMYSYPEDGAWGPMWNQVEAHPNVKFQIIMNPDNGPGSTKYPEAAYITALTRLNSYPNVKLLGYVHTLYSTRSYEQVTKEIDTYAGWSSYTKSNISVSGIFFDEVTAKKSGDAKTYISNAAAYAYSQLSAAKKTVVLNPGTVVDTSYFDFADSIVQFENPYDTYDGQATINTFQTGYKKNSAIILNGASGLAAAKIQSLVDTVKTSNVGGVYFTSDCCYSGVNNTLLNHIATAVAAH